jgi:hypothetical protein
VVQHRIQQNDQQKRQQEQRVRSQLQLADMWGVPNGAHSIRHLAKYWPAWMVIGSAPRLICICRYLLGKYDFSDEKLRDSIGIRLITYFECFAADVNCRSLVGRCFLSRMTSSGLKPELVIANCQFPIATALPIP